ncbi:hypothetical protein [Streptomyces sp. PH10-H1]|uniref:hypothetical protein n=1 Tax=Streptomyces sp. PH10-H1 TaxID=3046212 RepID=UPI0024BAB5DA|nr:hypothetical protein [Streptomyces sp. PH10-H1]MDJ0342516.1 hypothetical protein [Streptomyces sp. PH10-H1]
MKDPVDDSAFPPPSRGAGPRLTLTISPAARLLLAGFPPDIAWDLADLESPVTIDIYDPKDTR